MNLKKFAAIACSALLAGGVLSGCNKEAPAASKDHIFESKVLIQDSEEFDNISNIVWDGTNIWFYANKWEQITVPGGEVDAPAEVMPLAVGDSEETATEEIEEPAEETLPAEETDASIADTTEAVIYEENVVYQSKSYSYIIKADIDGNIIKKVTLAEHSSDANAYVNYSGLIAAKDGKIYGNKQSSTYGTDEQGNYFGEDKTEIVTYDSELNETVVLDVSEVLSKESTDENSYFYVSSFLVDSNSIVYINAGMGAYAVDPASGKVLVNYTIDESSNTGNEYTYIQDLCMMPDGSVAVVQNVSKVVDNDYVSNITASKFNLSTGKLDEGVNFPISYGAIPGVGDYSFFTSDQVAVYGYDKDAANRTVIIDLLASAIADVSIYTLVPITADEFIISGYSNTDGSTGIYLLNKVDPSTITEKKLIRVAALYDDYYLIQYIRNFNKTNAEYQVEFKQYSTDPNSTYSQNITAFNNDIISGNIPDVILVDSSMPYDSYTAKGLLKDLKPLLNEDPDLKLESLVPSIVDVLSIDGKLYSLAPSFTVSALIGKTSIFGNEPGQTLAELQSKADAIPGANLFDTTTTRDDFMTRFVYNFIGNFYDMDTGKCYFDTPEFISLLNTAKGLPEEFNYEDYDWMAAQSMYKNDKTLLEYAYMYDFRAIVQEELVTFGAPVTIMGYPGKDGETGITAMLSQEMAIMAKAKNPDGAWAFLKGFITYIDPNSKGDVTSRGNYSILQADLEKLAELALDRPYYLDYETREKVYYDNTAYVDNQEIPIPNNTAEDNAKIMEMIANISSVQRSENELQTIIEDDIKAFFTGQKSAEETAAIIQNRASTYVAESR